MDHSLYTSFAPIVAKMTSAELEAEIKQPNQLLIGSHVIGGRKIDLAYAPFDFVNPDAEIVIVGLTPGRQQMANALRAFRTELTGGASSDAALKVAKHFASFSGPMRSNLVAMLDSIGIHTHMGIASTASLWGPDSGRIHFTSVLRYPVFLDEANYSGAPAPSAPELKTAVMRWFAMEMATLSNAIFVPLGPLVSQVVEEVARGLNMSGRQILSGLPHPSGANAERIAYFLGRKQREALSNKVNPDKLNVARQAIDLKMKLIAG